MPGYLASGSHSFFVQQQVHTLLKEVEQHQREFCCCLAGHKDKMEQMMKSMPGLSRRFAARVHLDDFTAAEIALICRRAMTERYNLVISEDLVHPETGYAACVERFNRLYVFI